MAITSPLTLPLTLGVPPPLERRRKDGMQHNGYNGQGD